LTRASAEAEAQNFFHDRGMSMSRIIIREDQGPMEIQCGSEKKWLCRCGLSKNQPWCDGNVGRATGIARHLENLFANGPARLHDRADVDRKLGAGSKTAALSRFAEPVIDSYLDGIRAIGAKKRPALRKVRA